MISIQTTFQSCQCLADIDLGRRCQKLRDSTETCAHAAAEFNVIEWLTVLLRQGFDINAMGGRYHTLLQASALMGHLNLVNILLENGAEAKLSGGRYGNALSAAAFNGNPKVVSALRGHGPDVNAGGGEYGPALHTAAQASPERGEVIKLLLDAKEDLNKHEGRHHSPLETSSFAGN